MDKKEIANKIREMFLTDIENGKYGEVIVAGLLLQNDEGKTYPICLGSPVDCAMMLAKMRALDPECFNA